MSDERVALITGADGGLGKAVTAAFLGSGARVAGVSRNIHADSAEGERFAALQADLSKPEAAEEVVTKTIERWGRLDVLVHLMGGFGGGNPVENTDDFTWNRMMTLNLHSAFYMMRAAIPHLTRAGAGRIVAVGSRAGTQPSPHYAAYAVSKAALHALVQTVAHEVRDSGITANVVMPSIIDTPANRQAMPDANYSTWVQPSSIATAILRLAAAEAGDVSGALVPIYGRA
jgi:NAD(P)-dependent dehydrogenase (short-subunit alcohol dehydrogenase family)